MVDGKSFKVFILGEETIFYVSFALSTSDDI